MSTLPVSADAVVLRAEDLSKSFGGIRAVDRLNLTLTRKELRCLIGPNGAGKSTLFSLLSGLHRPDAGHIVFKGEDITHLPPFQRVVPSRRSWARDWWCRGALRRSTPGRGREAPSV